MLRLASEVAYSWSHAESITSFDPSMSLVLILVTLTRAAFEQLWAWSKRRQPAALCPQTAPEELICAKAEYAKKIKIVERKKKKNPPLVSQTLRSSGQNEK